MQVVEHPQTSKDEITIILGALSALKRGDASVRLPAEWHGVLGRVAKLGETFIHVEVANGVELQVQRASVVQVLPKGTFK